MLATEQSVDITAQLLSMGVELIAGRGELVDAAPGLARHRVKVTARDGSTTIRDADVVLIATGASPRILPSAPARRRAHPDLAPALRPGLAARPPHRGGLRGDRHRIRQRLHRTGCDRDGGSQPRPGVAARGRRRRAVLEESFAERGVTTGQERPRSNRSRAPTTGVLVTMTDGRTVEGSHALMTHRVGAQHQRPRSTAGRHRTRAGQLHHRRPGVADTGRRHLRRRGLHWPAAVGLGRRDAGPDRDVSRAR